MGTDNNTKEELFTEEMAKKIADELGASASENEQIAMIRDVLNNGGHVDEVINPDTVMAEDYDANLFDLVEEESKKVNLIDLAINGIDNNEFDIEELVKRSASIFPSTEKDDIVKLINIAKRYRDGENFSVYSELPESIKATIKAEAGAADKTALNLFAKMVIEEFITEVLDMVMDKEAIDFNESLKEALEIPDITQMYQGYIRERFEVDLIEKANALEEESPKGAEVLRKCSEAFTDTYTFGRMRAAIKGKVRRKLYKDIEFYSRFCNDFNAKIKNSKFRINDVFEFGRVLDKMAPIIGISNEDVMMFVVLFCKTCQNLDPNDVSDGVFMYYTIRNVLNMEHHHLVGLGAKDPDEFDQTIIDNIALLVNDIHVMINERSN